MADLVLQIEDFALKRAPMRQQKPDAEARCAFDIDVRTPERTSCSSSPISSSAVHARDAAIATHARGVGGDRLALDSAADRLQRGGDARLLHHAVSHFPLRRFYAALPCILRLGIVKRPKIARCRAFATPVSLQSLPAIALEKSSRMLFGRRRCTRHLGRLQVRNLDAKSQL